MDEKESVSERTTSLSKCGAGGLSRSTAAPSIVRLGAAWERSMLVIVVTVTVVVFERAERLGDVRRDLRRVGAVARIQRAAGPVAEPVRQIDGDRDVGAGRIDRDRRRELRLDACVDRAREDERLTIERPLDTHTRVLELGMRDEECH